MLAYSVAEIMRIILSVYTEWRNATPGGRLALSLGNRKQMLSSWPAPPAALLSLLLSLHLSTLLISKQLKGRGCENTLRLWHTEPGFINKLVPRNQRVGGYLLRNPLLLFTFRVDSMF